MASHVAGDNRLRPFEAMRAVRKLIANPGDTSQVFVIFRAMRGRSGQRSFRRFVESPVGQAALRERRDLFPLLTDREGLRRMPPGSLGRAYLEFVEAENLSAQGLVEASQEWDNDPQPADVELFRRRMRELHDVNHVVTGYGRDQLGELCLLTFMYRQQGNLGMLLIVIMAWSQVPRQARKTIREAWRNGGKASWLPGQDWETLLARPLDEIRGELKVRTPALYQAVAA
jgi:ubiquinone biosynthesis protein COQ4